MFEDDEERKHEKKDQEGRCKCNQYYPDRP
jgi:hypothetical protein